MAKSNAIAVVNAGSSRIKYSVYSNDGEEPSVFLKGQIGGQYIAGTQFSAREVGGNVVRNPARAGRIIGQARKESN